MDGVGTPIIGRPRPLPSHDTPNPAHNTYTLKCEEPLKQRGMVALGLSIGGLLFGILAIVGLIMGIMVLNKAKSVGDVEAAKTAKYAVIAGCVVVTLNVVFSVLYVMGS